MYLIMKCVESNRDSTNSPRGWGRVHKLNTKYTQTVCIWGKEQMRSMSTRFHHTSIIECIIH